LPELLNISAAPVVVLGDGRYRLDSKFVQGLRQSASHWNGRYDVLLWQGHATIPFGADYAEQDLGFRLQVLGQNEWPAPRHLQGYDIIAATADLHTTLDLPRHCSRPGQPRLVYSIEYTLGTRLRIIGLDSSRNAARKLRSALWTLAKERRRRAALRAADGVQANGYPAMQAFAPLNPDTFLYLDNRMTAGMMASDAEQAARAAHLATGGPLRFIHSGRLERMKGAQDLLPIARRLADERLDFTLDIYGTGTCEADIRSGIARHDLAHCVRLHALVDFETRLVPLQRQTGDVFLSCHRQADPSCTYIESMGCGLPVIGYDNAMFRALSAESRSGWHVPLGNWRALADRIITLNAARAEITAHSQRALAFARQHDFHTTFARRDAHLAAIATRPPRLHSGQADAVR
jgi:colanic acid/amylovoran biosynthesis glycosyltransferase